MKDIKFVLLGGDNFYENGCANKNDSKFKTAFEIPYKHIPNDIKFFGCLGNHCIHHPNGHNAQFDYSEHSIENDMKFILRFNLNNSLVSKEDTNVRAINTEAKIKSIRLSLRLQNDAYGRGNELRKKLYSMISKKLNYDGNENSSEFYIKDGRTISLSSDYSNIYINYDYPEIQ